ncbi:hypothetical protein BGW80DRAFT_1443666 [Lactifluus volemus]|nr:hypothetical protein BGW80DRAFT_1443666 [Lactifluus volemus]
MLGYHVIVLRGGEPPLRKLNKNFVPSPKEGSLSSPSLSALLPSPMFPPLIPTSFPHSQSHGALSARDSVFLTSRSRVLRFYNLPPLPSVFLHDLFLDVTRDKKCPVPIPKSLWTRRAEYVGVHAGSNDGVWAVFGTHEEARSALALFSLSVSTSPALESDLEPLHSLQRFQLRTAGPPMSLESPIPANDLLSSDVVSRQPRSPWPSHLSPSLSSLSIPPSFTLSSNPPNPRTVFRLGDWMCPSAHCAAHNFGRNFSCIGCGSPRPSSLHVPSPRTPFTTFNPSLFPSPRFVGTPEPEMPTSLSHRIPHILTPSGRAFSVGGRVQDISSDPLSPCILFWPDNEPLPEQGQIRPSNLVGVPHPPILNTGNRGPIEHQPGDWICQTCNYLNWRRRKVCQTCYPYAEGNGDSIPSAVQADRIKRLRDALASTLPLPLSTVPTPSLNHLQQSPSKPVQSPLDCYPNPYGCPPARPSALHSLDQNQSNVELGSRSKDTIYQTSTPPVSFSYPDSALLPMDDISGPFLPSCLQGIVQSPSLSPTSTTSADLSVDDYVASPVSVYSTSNAKHPTNGERPFLTEKKVKRYLVRFHPRMKSHVSDATVAFSDGTDGVVLLDLFFFCESLGPSRNSLAFGDSS